MLTQKTHKTRREVPGKWRKLSSSWESPGTGFTGFLFHFSQSTAHICLHDEKHFVVCKCFIKKAARRSWGSLKNSNNANAARQPNNNNNRHIINNASAFKLMGLLVWQLNKFAAGSLSWEKPAKNTSEEEHCVTVNRPIPGWPHVTPASLRINAGDKWLGGARLVVRFRYLSASTAQNGVIHNYVYPLFCRGC